MKVTIVEASIPSLDAFITLADEVGEWLWNKGIKQWVPGLHASKRDQLATMVEQGCLILAYHADILIGGCILSDIEPSEWPSVPNGMALNALVVARSTAGQDIGKHIIQGCIQSALKRGKTRIRLDCWDGNDFLKGYYQAEGFTMLQKIREKDYSIRLFEMKLLQDNMNNEE